MHSRDENAGSVCRYVRPYTSQVQFYEQFKKWLRGRKIKILTGHHLVMDRSLIFHRTLAEKYVKLLKGNARSQLQQFVVRAT